MKRVPLFVLNNFIKFERKIYQVFGVKLGRPLSFKMVLYAIFFGVIELILYNLPILGNLINWLPFAILVTIPVLLGWLLADVGTEGRSPIFFFRSFFAYQKRKWIDKSTLYRGRQISKIRNYQFRNYFTFKEPVVEAEVLPFSDTFDSFVGQNHSDSNEVNTPANSQDTELYEMDSASEPPINEKSETVANDMSDMTKEKEFKTALPQEDMSDMKDTTNMRAFENPEDIKATSAYSNVMTDINNINGVSNRTKKKAEEAPAEEVKKYYGDDSHLHISNKKSKGSKEKKVQPEKTKDKISKIQYAYMIMRYRSKMKKSRKKGR